MNKTILGTMLFIFVSACIPASSFATEGMNTVKSMLDVEYYIKLPAKYDSDRRRGYPVIYILGSIKSSDNDPNQIWNTLNNIFVDVEIEPIITVILNTTPAAKENSKNSVLFKRNVMQEAINYVDQHYNTRPKREERLLIGGMQAGAQGLTLPHLFKGVLIYNFCDLFTQEQRDHKLVSEAIDEYSQQSVRIPFYIVATNNNKHDCRSRIQPHSSKSKIAMEAVQLYQQLHNVNLFQHHFNKYGDVPASPAELRIKYLSQSTNFVENDIAEGLRYFFENTVISSNKLDDDRSINQIAQKGTVLTKRDILQNNTINRHDNLTYQVYLPYGYNGQSSIKYPVLYLLHGSGGNDESWNEFWTILDEMIERKVISPVIAVAPITGNSYWVDSKKYGAIESTVIQDLIPAIDASYSTIKQKSGRGIIGFSMGGYGALRYALTYPELFNSAALLSPAIQQGEPPITSGAVTRGAFEEPFNLSKWYALNYPSALKLYSAQNHRVPIYIITGDDEWNHLSEKEDLPKDAFRYNMEVQAVTLYNHLTQVEDNNLNQGATSLAELNIVNGGHNMGVWSKGFQDGIKFMFSHGLSSGN